MLGAQLAAPERPCISVCGDGGFTMTPYVVATAVEYELPCIWVVWNNFSWAAIRDIQVGMFGNRQLGTAFYPGGHYGQTEGKRYNPDFAAYATSCGALGLPVRTASELPDALAAAFTHDGPACVHIRTDAALV